MPSLIERVVGTVANRRRMTVDLTAAITNVTREGSLDTGFPSVVLTITSEDAPRLLASDVLLAPTTRALGEPDGFALRPIDIELDGVFYRLAQAQQEDDGTGTLTFDHRGKVFMTEHDWALSASRSAMTRAEFERRQVLEIGRVRGEVADLDFWAPELRRRMLIAPVQGAGKLSSRADLIRNVHQVHDDASKFKGLTVNGRAMNAEQRKNAAIVMQVAAEVQAGPKATLAAMCAAIGESELLAQMNQGGSGYGGVFQGDVAAKYRYFRVDETRAQAQSFFRGGKGFQSGGAIAAARAHPDWSAGTIAYMVEGDRSNFASDAAAENFYLKHRREAAAIIDAAGLTVGAGTGQGGSYVAQYRFRRDEGTDAWASTGSIADEVGKRRFITVVAPGDDIFVYSSDEDLWRLLPSQLTISKDDPSVIGFNFDLDYGKTLQQAQLTVVGDVPQRIAWGIPITLTDAGSANGKWIVWGISEDDSQDGVQVDLRQPQPTKPEPASQVVQRSSATDTPLQAGDVPVLAAYSKAVAISELDYPYVWGGGHGHAGRPDHGTGSGQIGFDCSGYVAACLEAGGMLPADWVTGVPASGVFASSWGKHGEGKHMTVWANSVHTFIEFKIKGKKGHYADTSRAAGGKDGPHIRYGTRSTAGFTPRHWPGSDSPKARPKSHKRKGAQQLDASGNPFQ